MHPGRLTEALRVFIQLDGHSEAPLCSTIKQMSSAVKCVSLYCRWRGSPVIFDSSLAPALAAVTTSETQKGNGGDILKSHRMQRSNRVERNARLQQWDFRVRARWRGVKGSRSRGRSSSSPGLQRWAQRLLGSWSCVQCLKTNPRWRPFKTANSVLFLSSFFFSFHGSNIHMSWHFYSPW